MRAYDFTPLYRQTVGFDRLFRMLDELVQFDGNQSPAYPPYNIENRGENAYRITMAVAGFSDSELNVEVKENALNVTGRKDGQETGEKPRFLHQGIAARSFERRFQLADHVEVTGASLENGLLHIDLERRIPEAKRAKRIAIGTGAGSNPQVIEQKAA